MAQAYALQRTRHTTKGERSLASAIGLSVTWLANWPPRSKLFKVWCCATSLKNKKIKGWRLIPR